MADETPARVVVVDDNPATLYSTSRVLRAAGFDVREGTTGEQALEFSTKAPTSSCSTSICPIFTALKFADDYAETAHRPPAGGPRFSDFRQRNR